MFNKETEYALRALVYIQSQNTKSHRPGVAEISREIDAPHHFTAKILQRSVKQGFVNSMKGIGGGFYFDANNPEIAIKDLISFIEGNKLFEGCGLGLKQCDENNPCPMHHKFAPIRDQINNLVETETIQSLANKIEN